RLAARVAAQVRIPPVGRHRPALLELLPRETVALARMVLAEVAVALEGVLGHPEGRREDRSRLGGPGHHAGVEHDLAVPQLARALQAVAERGDLQPSPVGQALAALVPTDDAELLSHRLTVAHQDDPRPEHAL